LKSIGQKGIAVAISANCNFCDHLESAGVKLQKNGRFFKFTIYLLYLATAVFANLIVPELRHLQ
jgi:hypothetical protein